MTSLPKDIEEALTTLSANYHIGPQSHNMDDLRRAILTHIHPHAPTQRQRYKEAALSSVDRGMFSPWTYRAVAEECGKYADALLAEDAEHAGRANP